MHALRKVLLGAVTMALLAVTPAAAHPPAGTVGVEPVYFEDGTLQIIQPSATSSNPNQGQFACFPLGPDQSSNGRASATPTMYVLAVPGATQHACADGALRHDHVLTAAPGSLDYTGVWATAFLVPGPFFDQGIMPLTNAGAVEAALAAGQVADAGIALSILAPVTGAQ